VPWCRLWYPGSGPLVASEWNVRLQWDSMCSPLTRKGPTRSMWTWRIRSADGVKLPNGVTVWRETFKRWQDWLACAQVWQCFCTPDHTERCATSFAVALVPGYDRSWTDWNTWSRRGAGTYSRDLPETCRSRWRPWYLRLVVFRAAGRWLPPGVFEARYRCPAMRTVRRRMVAQWRTRRERGRRQQRCLFQKCAVCLSWTGRQNLVDWTAAVNICPASARRHRWWACGRWIWWSDALPAYSGNNLWPRRWPVARGRRRCTSGEPGSASWRRRRGAARHSWRLTEARHAWRTWRHL
jgi:hypothetical protein